MSFIYVSSAQHQKIWRPITFEFTKKGQAILLSNHYTTLTAQLTTKFGKFLAQGQKYGVPCEVQCSANVVCSKTDVCPKQCFVEQNTTNNKSMSTLSTCQVTLKALNNEVKWCLFNSSMVDQLETLGNESNLKSLCQTKQSSSNKYMTTLWNYSLCEISVGIKFSHLRCKLMCEVLQLSDKC